MIYSPKRMVILMSYDPTQLQKPGFNWAGFRHLPLALQLLGLSCAIVALARPQSAKQVIERKTTGIDLMIALDVSGSMEANDFKPNRLEVAKIQADSFVQNRNGDRIGMVLFAEDAFSYAPLTQDYTLLSKLIRNINFSIVPKQGTAVGSAITIGIHRLRESQTQSKVMLLFTDGASNRGEIDPITAARLAQMYKIKIHTISIGKDNFVPNSAETASVESDPTTLKKIAKITGGRFFQAQDASALQKVFQEISIMEKTESKEEVYRDINDLYPSFTLAAIICFLLAYLLMLSFFYNPLEQ
jgi:Ca-activated chloride channel homolog